MDSTNDFFLAGFGNDDRSGVYRYGMDAGFLTQRCFFRLNDASYLALSSSGNTLYAALENKDHGGLASFRVEPDGGLALISELRTPGMGFCHLAVSPDEKVVYTADYVNGRVGMFLLQDGGRILSFDTPIQHSGHSVHVPRQQGPHVHYCIFSPDFRYLCVVDLGLDCVFFYPLNPDYTLSGEAPKATSIVPSGSGPRHLVFRGDERKAYLVNELSNTVMVFAYHDGDLTLLQTLPLLPEHTRIYSKASAIRLSPDGRFVMVSNRGYDTIATFLVSPDGSLSPYKIDFVGVKSPRDFNFLPGGAAILVGGELSGDAYLFSFDADNGMMIPDGQILQDLPKPICVL